MPHIHMLLILDKACRITTPEQVDQYVSARLPALPPPDDLSPEANQRGDYGTQLHLLCYTIATRRAWSKKKFMENMNFNAKNTFLNHTLKEQ